MNPAAHRPTHPAAATLLAAALALPISGCESGGSTPRNAHAAPAASTTPAVSSPDPLALSDARGRPLPPRPDALPTDPAAATRLGLYATPAQVEALRRRLHGDIVEVTVPRTRAGYPPTTAVTEAVAAVQSLQDDDRPHDAPVFVKGPDLRVAARVADHLADGGLTRVWLVVAD
jgi:hypothetical protein